MLFMGEISNCGRQSGENVWFFVEDAVNEQEALSCSQEPSGGSRLYGSPFTERAVGEQQR